MDVIYGFITLYGFLWFSGHLWARVRETALWLRIHLQAISQIPN